MHYKNGREAKNGDKVVLFPSYGAPVIGILYDATAGNDYCNGKIAPVSPSDPCPNLKECLHLDDVLKALPESVPDSSKPADAPKAAESVAAPVTGALLVLFLLGLLLPTPAHAQGLSSVLAATLPSIALQVLHWAVVTFGAAVLAWLVLMLHRGSQYVASKTKDQAQQTAIGLADQLLSTALNAAGLTLIADVKAEKTVGQMGADLLATLKGQLTAANIATIEKGLGLEGEALWHYLMARLAATQVSGKVLQVSDGLAASFNALPAAVRAEAVKAGHLPALPTAA